MSISITTLDDCTFRDLAKRLRRAKAEGASDQQLKDRFDLSDDGLKVVILYCETIEGIEKSGTSSTHFRQRFTDVL